MIEPQWTMRNTLEWRRLDWSGSVGGASTRKTVQGNPTASRNGRRCSFSLPARWRCAVAGPNFGEFSNAIVVNNFGDGHVNGFSRNGQFLGPLRGADHNPLIVDGIWSIVSPSGVSAVLDQNTLYFAAGPDGESHGTFGTISLAAR